MEDELYTIKQASLITGIKEFEIRFIANDYKLYYAGYGGYRREYDLPRVTFKDPKSGLILIKFKLFDLINLISKRRIR